MGTWRWRRRGRRLRTGRCDEAEVVRHRRMVDEGVSDHGCDIDEREGGKSGRNGDDGLCALAGRELSIDLWRGDRVARASSRNVVASAAA